MYMAVNTILFADDTVLIGRNEWPTKAGMNV